MRATSIMTVALLALTFQPFVSAISLAKESKRKLAPNFELQGRDGELVRLSDYAGKVVLLDFWATWCGPCRESIPWFNELSKKYGDDGFAVIGISMDQDGWEVVKPFVEKMQVRYPVVIGNARVAYLYGDVDSLPLAFLIDRDQRVAGIHLGPASKKEFEKAVQALLDRP
jgi:cytochrome c biogenesis protein CcmG/thiol:disulfide interchange protein DsbE